MHVAVFVKEIRGICSIQFFAKYCYVAFTFQYTA